MSDFAVIKLQGSQYVVREGDVIEVDKLKDPTKLNYQVLMMSKAGKFEIGKPDLSDKKLKLKVVDEVVKGEKIRVFKYKSKSRYRKTQGFRPLYSKLLVDKI